MIDAINSLFVSVLNWIYSWVGNYGWSVVVFTLIVRLLVLPLLTLLLFRASGLASWTADGSTILLISFLAAAAPCASTVTQMSHLYGHNGEYASLINVVSTLLCVITMPVMVFLFQL